MEVANLIFERFVDAQPWACQMVAAGNCENMHRHPQVRSMWLFRWLAGPSPGLCSVPLSPARAKEFGPRYADATGGGLRSVWGCPSDRPAPSGKDISNDQEG